MRHVSRCFKACWDFLDLFRQHLAQHLRFFVVVAAAAAAVMDVVVLGMVVVRSPNKREVFFDFGLMSNAA